MQPLRGRQGDQGFPATEEGHLLKLVDEEKGEEWEWMGARTVIENLHKIWMERSLGNLYKMDAPTMYNGFCNRETIADDGNRFLTLDNTRYTYAKYLAISA